MIRTSALSSLKQCFCLAGVLSLTGCGFLTSPDPGPEDSAVRAMFSRNEAVFDQLHTMIHLDTGIRAIGHDMIIAQENHIGVIHTTDNEALARVGLSRGRYNEYLRLLRKIGAKRVSVPSAVDWEKTRVCIHSSGIVPENFSVDVVRVGTESEKRMPRVITGDTKAATVKDNSVAYAKLNADWYVRREHD